MHTHTHDSKHNHVHMQSHVCCDMLASVRPGSDRSASVSSSLFGSVRRKLSALDPAAVEIERLEAQVATLGEELQVGPAASWHWRNTQESERLRRGGPTKRFTYPEACLLTPSTQNYLPTNPR
eukprot:704640-Pleurochrysis_carterae.AAC.2